MFIKQRKQSLRKYSTSTSAEVSSQNRAYVSAVRVYSTEVSSPELVDKDEKDRGRESAAPDTPEIGI